MVRHKALMVGAVVGTAMAVATLELQHFVTVFAVYLLIPGVLFSAAISGNVHAFPLSIAAAGNFLFWLLVCWGVGSLIAKIRRGRAPRDDADSSIISS